MAVESYYVLFVNSVLAVRKNVPALRARQDKNRSAPFLVQYIFFPRGSLLRADENRLQRAGAAETPRGRGLCESDEKRYIRDLRIGRREVRREWNRTSPEVELNFYVDDTRYRPDLNADGPEDHEILHPLRNPHFLLNDTG